MACLKLLSFELGCLRFKDVALSDIDDILLIRRIVFGSCHIVRIHFFSYLFYIVIVYLSIYLSISISIYMYVHAYEHAYNKATAAAGLFIKTRILR